MIFFFLFVLLWGEVFAEMSLEEKVGQVMMVHFHGETANEEAKMLLEHTHAGGILYYQWANGLNNPAQVQELSRSLQQMNADCGSEIPLFIGIDQEGGSVCRLKNGFTHMPSQNTIAETYSEEKAQELYYNVAAELIGVGINMNFSPVVDINSMADNSLKYMFKRTFGNDPETVTKYARAALLGYKKAGLISTLKHFPGIGDTTVDSHADLPILLKSFEDLQLRELYPYIQLANEADVMMTAHLLVPALDPVNPSTLSSATLKFLREEIGFNGVIISDSLLMKGILASGITVDEAAICAFNAGCDLLMLGGALFNVKMTQIESELKPADFISIHQSLVKAVREGRISQERLDEAVFRIMALKQRTFCPRHPN
jgi:beta-N-acetylhexosaminidase